MRLREFHSIASFFPTLGRFSRRFSSFANIPENFGIRKFALEIAEDQSMTALGTVFRLSYEWCRWNQRRRFGRGQPRAARRGRVVVVCAVGMPNRQTSPWNHSRRPPFLQPYPLVSPYALFLIFSRCLSILFLSSFLFSSLCFHIHTHTQTYTQTHTHIFLLRGFLSTIARLFLYLHFLPARYLPSRIPLPALICIPLSTIFLDPPAASSVFVNQSPQHISFICYFLASLFTSLPFFLQFSFILFSSSCLLAYYFFCLSIIVAFPPSTLILINLTCRHFLLLFILFHIFIFSSLQCLYGFSSNVYPKNWWMPPCSSLHSVSLIFCWWISPQGIYTYIYRSNEASFFGVNV